MAEKRLICVDNLPEYMEKNIYHVRILIKTRAIKPIDDNDNKYLYRIDDIDNYLAIEKEKNEYRLLKLHVGSYK